MEERICERDEFHSAVKDWGSEGSPKETRKTTEEKICEKVSFKSEVKGRGSDRRREGGDCDEMMSIYLIHVCLPSSFSKNMW